MKKCSKCKIEKEYSDFHKNSKSKDGYKSICKSCILGKEKERRGTDEYKEKKRLYFESLSSDKIKSYKKRYYKKNKEKVDSKSKKYRQDNKEILREKNKEYREKNKELLREKRREYRENNKHKRKEWEKNNVDKMKSYRKKYLESDKVKEHRKNWYKSIKRRKPYVIAWRSLLNNTLKRISTKKEEETIKLLGYSAIQLRDHIESLFLEGMSWDNYGDWQIDHIKMVSRFDPETPVHIINSLDNLRPLWASDNCSRKLNN